MDKGIINNEVKVEILSRIENVAIARAIGVSFLVNINPPISFVNEFKTVISEAVTNAIVHGYENRTNKYVYLSISYDDDYVYLTVEDKGVGIDNIETAKEPLYTTKIDEERAGLGFTIMEVFTDLMEISSTPGKGTLLSFKKKYQRGENNG